MPSILFNPATARQAAAISATARRGMRAEQKRQAAIIQGLTAQLASLKPAPNPALPNAVPLAQSDRLARVRKQLRAIDDKIDAELARTDCHPKAVEALARAAQVLAEQERVLDGRPLPGTLRPKGSGPAGAGHAPNRTPPTAE